MDNLDFGVIGNGRSAALVSLRGSIDFCCLAEFDSPSVFAALLDESRGGRFSIESAYSDAQVDQRYLRHTNVLVTRYTREDEAFEIIDFMPRHRTDAGEYNCPPDIVRLVRPLKGTPRVRIVYDPRLNYAEYETKLTRYPKYLKATTLAGAYESLYLYSSVSLEGTREAQEFTLTDAAYFWLSYNEKLGLVDLHRAELEFERTKVYWMDWCSRTTPVINYREHVDRSALVLKMLAVQHTGALIAAVTTSLPESIGEVRNWDYRFCWIRDASMTIRTLVNLGHSRAARRFFEFLLNVVPYKDARIQIMYGIRGQTALDERTLDWLRGYEGSAPVRIGNAAWTQRQNDTYGVLLDVLHEGFVLFEDGSSERESLWTTTRGMVRHIESHWSEPDQGIWEIRGEPRHFTHSKMMCWVGLDRAIKIARRLGCIDYIPAWCALAERIRADIEQNGYDPKRGAFTQSYHSQSLDAANLLMWRMGFIEADDPRWVSTVWATYRELCVDGLMYRYRNADDFGVPKSAFTVCTFWMIQALISIEEHERARSMFEALLSRSNHVGLFSEDLDFQSRRLLGNFPQAYSHLALIDTAMLLDGVSARLAPRPLKL